MIDKPLTINFKPEHEHANGLVGGFILDDYNCSNSIDFVNNNNLQLQNTEWGNTGLKATVSNSLGIFDNTNEKLFNDTVGTVIMYLKSYADFNDGVRQNMFGVYYANSSTKGIFIRKDSNNRVNFYIQGTSLGALSTISDKYPNWKTGNQLAFQWDKNNYIFDNKECAINVDGKYISSITYSIPSPWTDFTFPQNVGLLNQYQDTASPFNGVCKYCYIYNKNISERLIKDIYENPFAMIIKKQNLHRFYNPVITQNIINRSILNGIGQGIYKGIG